MDDVIIITEILKYFNFEELCIAERINPNFKNKSKFQKLRQLGIASFHYTQLDEDLLYQRIMKDLYFVSLQNI
uniref:Uncharacterized protein n=1 Tax=Romanomermis culicivorax TaxID=13658 RepID=A0A915HHC8_ROMCU